MPFSISSQPEPLHNRRLVLYAEVRMVGEFKKSRNPLEHGIVLNGKIGYVIQVVGDGYCLIDFPQFIVKRKFKMETLEWYVHETDLYLTNN
jgi:hypothetical protein